MSAIISDDQQYRYRLTRDFGMVGVDTCCFIMLNPSTADAEQDDPTIRRCIGYAKALGCGELTVVNLFAYRSTDPKALYGMSKQMAIGPDNDRHIAEACNASGIVICAWGNHGNLFKRSDEVLKLVMAQHGARPMALKVGKTGQPSHPLYLKADAKPFPIFGTKEVVQR